MKISLKIGLRSPVFFCLKSNENFQIENQLVATIFRFQLGDLKKCDFRFII